MNDRISVTDRVEYSIKRAKEKKPGIWKRIKVFFRKMFSLKVVFISFSENKSVAVFFTKGKVYYIK